MLQDFFVKYCGATWGVVLIIGPFFGAKASHAGVSSSGAAGWSLEDRAAMLSQMRYHTSVVISLFAAMGTLAASSRHFIRLRCAGRGTHFLTRQGPGELRSSPAVIVNMDSLPLRQPLSEAISQQDMCHGRLFDRDRHV